LQTPLDREMEILCLPVMPDSFDQQARLRNMQSHAMSRLVSAS
jgi:hypothetical protein